MGPSAGLILADLGADVIKIEPAPGRYDPPPLGFAAGFFGTFNRNKRSLAVDLKRREAVRLSTASPRRRRRDRELRARHHGPAGCGYDDLRRSTRA